MNLTVAISVFVGFSAVCYFLLGVRLAGGQRELGSVPLGIAFLIIAWWRILKKDQKKVNTVYLPAIPG